MKGRVVDRKVVTVVDAGEVIEEGVFQKRQSVASSTCKHMSERHGRLCVLTS